jgi:hypothetical protein
MTDANESTLTDAKLNKRSSGHIKHGLGTVTRATTHLNHVLTLLHVADDEATSRIHQTSGSLEKCTGSIHDYRAVTGTTEGACGAVEGIVRIKL